MRTKESEGMGNAVEKSAMRKIYWRLLPFAILSYFLAYIDRINVSFAGLTMRDDLSMSSAAFGFALGTFYWGYFIFEVPSNLILERVGARLWIARIMITWGILSGATAFCTGPWSFLVIRFVPAVLLGIAVLFYVTDRPAEARWLSEAERAWLVAVIDDERRRIETRRKFG